MLFVIVQKWMPTKHFIKYLLDKLWYDIDWTWWLAKWPLKIFLVVYQEYVSVEFYWNCYYQDN